MPAYSGKAQPFLDAIAEGMFSDRALRDWVLQGTTAVPAYLGADIIEQEQRDVRWANKPTKQPFWANYWCGRDTRCECRPAGSKGLESDAIFFLRRTDGRVLAVHVEFKHPAEQLSFGQAEAYPMRAACFARTHATRKTLNAHDDWTTVLFCGDEMRGDPETNFFERTIFHSEAKDRITSWPS